MKKNYIEFAAKKLVGISVRTNNANEMTADKAQIGKTIGNFYSESLTDQIGTKTNPGVIYSVYTNYDSDHTGDYTYFVGEEVDAFEAHNTLEQLEIPAQKYAVFTAGPAPMPQVIIEAWQAIWQMDENEIGGRRNYLADLQICNEKSINQAIVSIYIGIK